MGTMVPVPTNRFVYMEFTVQASNSTIPSVAMGLSPPDCPLNVSVGSWTKSVGLYSDLHLSVASRLYDCVEKSRRQVTAGNNIGILVYIPSPIPTTTNNQVENDTSINSVPSAVAVNNDTDKYSALARAFSYVVQVVSPGRDGIMVNNQGAVSPTCNSIGKKIQQMQCDDSVIDDNIQGEHTSPTFVSESNSQEVPVIVQYNIDGTPIHFAQSRENIQEIAHMNAPLYPTVSIMSEGTKIWCRMSEADQIYRSRDAIGAPAGTKVYCMDGSLLIRDDE